MGNSAGSYEQQYSGLGILLYVASAKHPASKGGHSSELSSTGEVDPASLTVAQPKEHLTEMDLLSFI